ncbi:hypothetical protein BJY04DRAFT_229322 [Aspergillus karnatakaensis]|uniref:uncharacterized protein n=1 Tax=Aspergillus karnatakaensis TaxID=1810916 RepID=UPI003CCCA8B7
MPDTNQSMWATVKCCLTHLLAIGVSSTIIALNVKGTYLGADLMSPVRSETINLMLFQLAAKAHEITIVASLGVMVLQYVRHELLFGDGLPLGLLGSGLTFNNLEYFFNKEFYGGLKYVASRGNRPRKVAFISFVILAGLVAALAGPASAVLLVPKSRDWSAGGTDFYLNGRESDFWPDSLSGDMSDLQQLCFQDNSTIPGFCPAGGYKSLWAHWGTLNSSTFQTQHVRSYAKELSGSRFYWPVSSASSLIPPLYALGDNQPGPNGRTSLVQPHAATVVMLQRLAEDWWKALRAKKGLEPNQVDDRTASAEFKNAIAVSQCAAPERLQTSQKTVNFPSMAGRFDFVKALPLDLDGFNLTRTDHLRFRWVHLPPKFGTASIGGLFETPWEGTPLNESSRIVVACTVQAGWVPATVYTDKYTFWTGWYPWNILFGDRTPAWNIGSDASTNGRVAFGDEWLNLLTPPVPTTPTGAGSWQPTTIESIFLNAGLPDDPSTRLWHPESPTTSQKTSLIESILTSVVVDGLSRTGSHLIFNTSTSSPPPQWPLTSYTPFPDFATRILNNKPALQQPLPLAPTTTTNPKEPEIITLRTKMHITGFSLQTSLASYLAMSVLCIHILMANSHIIYVLTKRHTSGCWSTVGELVALAQSSKPASEVLVNSVGAIEKAATYARVARVRVVGNGNREGEGVELVFDGDGDEDEDSPRSKGGGGHENGHGHVQELNDMQDSLLRSPATWPRSQSQSQDRGWGSSMARVELIQSWI